MKFSKSCNILIIVTGITLLAIFMLYLGMSINKQELISQFPIENYDQTISHWINPADKDYDLSLLTPAQQKMRKDELFVKYFGARSPWSSEYINQIFSKPLGEDLQTAENAKLDSLSNNNKTDENIQYGSNFIPHPPEWLQQIQYNMNLQQFTGKQFEAQYRGITVNNMQGRVLPTNEVSFNSHKIAGQGYPFDNLQAAMIWTGTPVYILGKTRDHSWSLVQTPNFIAWIESNGIAKADDQFVRAWVQQAEKNIAAITQTKLSIIDLESDTYRFTAYIGMLFPATSNTAGIRIAIPVADSNRSANIHYAQLSHQQAALIPFLPTPHHFADLMQQLINRPYGWGGMYAFSDCSAELKNLFIPFGILLPAHSSSQVDPESFIVKQVDLSQADINERLSWLAEHGHKFMTIVYIGGHVFLYLGNYTSPANPKETIILTYQEMWGLKPAKAIMNSDSRFIIGKSVLFPLLKSYPEKANLVSQANKAYFQLGYLDPAPDEVRQPLRIDLKSDVSP